MCLLTVYDQSHYITVAGSVNSAETLVLSSIAWLYVRNDQ